MTTYFSDDLKLTSVSETDVKHLSPFFMVDIKINIIDAKCIGKD